MKQKAHKPHEIAAVRINNLRVACMQKTIADKLGVDESAFSRWLKSGHPMCSTVSVHESKVAQVFKLLGLELKR
jgi:DNA-binding transcriptional regulator YdaS (Cro superfamily)